MKTFTAGLLALLSASHLTVARSHRYDGRADGPCAPFSGNFTIDQYQLYPENADWDSRQCLLYLGSLFNGTVAVYDPYKAQIVEVLVFPGVSYNSLLHVGGVDYDERTGLWSIVADGAAPFNTGGKDVSGPNYAFLYDPVKKSILYNVNLTAVAGGKYSGFQDLEQDPRGNVYVVGTYSSSIIKISPDGKEAKTWYLQQPVNQTRAGLSGLASWGNILLAADNDGGKVVRFDLTKDEGTKITVPLTPANSTLGASDAVIIPAKYNGTVLLVALDVVGTAVIVSKDGKWETAEYKGVIPRVTTGDAAGSLVTANVQISGSLYSLQEWFDVPLNGSLAGARSKFPLIDISKEVDALVKK